jgi:N-acyl-D-aspartate/D-glutamate deacylase
MNDMYDLVIRDGLIVDGSGGAAFTGDVAISGERIAAVGRVSGAGREEIAADGLLVTPGFVDIHTHYDGQATWDAVLTPSSWHGITTVVMGNCGVGFAPVKPERHDWLIGLMEGVEDIPGTALTEGMTWGWETFPEYMDVLASMPRSIDVAAQVPHGALRTYVMGERGAKNEAASEADMRRMADLAGEAMDAGALGFSTSRTMFHQSVRGEVVPGTLAEDDELLAIAAAISSRGGGIVEVASDFNPCAQEFSLLEKLAALPGIKVTFGMVELPKYDEDWRQQLARADAATARGRPIVAQFPLRGVGYLMGWRSSQHPFFTKPSFLALSHLSWPDQLAALRDPKTRRRIIAEPAGRPVIDKGPLTDNILKAWDRQFALGANIDYEPPQESAIGEVAARTGRDPAEIAYDAMMECDGEGLIYLPGINYLKANLDHTYEQLNRPNTVISLSDGGAHCGAMCDAGSTTFLLSYWVRDRKGPRISLELAVHRHARETALLYGLADRGLLAPGHLADLNIIDYAKLGVQRPYMAFDLPLGGRRLMQQANGYVATIKRGIVTFRNGEHSGALPGRLIRGAQRALAN